MMQLEGQNEKPSGEKIASLKAPTHGGTEASPVISIIHIYTSGEHLNGPVELSRSPPMERPTQRSERGIWEKSSKTFPLDSIHLESRADFIFRTRGGPEYAKRDYTVEAIG